MHPLKPLRLISLRDVGELYTNVMSGSIQMQL